MARFARVELQSNQGLQSSAGLWSTATLASSQTIIRSEKARRFDRRAGVPGWQWHEFRTREVSSRSDRLLLTKRLGWLSKSRGMKKQKVFSGFAVHVRG